MPHKPLEALKKARTLSQGRSPLQEAAIGSFDAIMEGLRGAIGVDVPDTPAGDIGQLLGTFGPTRVFHLPDSKALRKRPGQYGEILEGERAARAIKSAATPDVTPPAVSAPEELHDLAATLTPATSTAKPRPPITQPGVTGPRASRGSAKANISMVKDIRRIGDIKKAAKAYPDLNPETIKDILRRHSWAWVE